MKKIVEEWKTIEGFPHHEISNFGRCRNTKLGLILSIALIKLNPDFSGNRSRPPYTMYCYRIQNNGRRIGRSAGKLVAQYFVPNPDGCKQIRYKDGNPSNYIYTNIEWV
jgi:hypothetical protein